MSHDWIDHALRDAEDAHLERHTHGYPATGPRLELDGRTVLNFSSNDYLGLARHPRVIAAAREALEHYGTGSTASRLICGTLPVHLELEARLAAHKGYAAALVFGTGYMTNAGVISSLVGRGDRIYADRLAHASMLDAARLSGARLHRFRHNDPAHLDHLLGKGGTGRALVLVEAVYSMDGDLAPLLDLAPVVRAHQALFLVDEAHSTGVFGPRGCGRVRELGLTGDVDICMGTLSKGLGSFGGFAACSEKLRRYLVNHARALIYTTAPPPAAMGAALGALEVVSDPVEMPGHHLLESAQHVRTRLQQGGLDTGESASQIIPLLCGSSEAALRLSAQLRERGLLGVAIRPPTVPAGTARIRLSLTGAHTVSELQQATDILLEVLAPESRS